MNRKIINLEINEISPSLFKNYINNPKNKKSILKKLMDQNLLKIYSTKATDISKEKLYPSQTWASFLSGLPYKKHNCYWYSDFIDYKNLIWSKLISNKKSVGIVGSLHSSKIPKNLFKNSNYKFFIPDCFSSVNKTKPCLFEDFQALNNLLVGSSGRVTGLKALFKIILNNGYKIFLNPRKFGISIFSLKMIFKIIFFAIKYQNKELLRMAQFPLIASIFYDLSIKFAPEYSSIFSNHIAGYMHRYWYAHDIKAFKSKNKYNRNWIRKNKNAIDISFGLLDDYIKYIFKNKQFRNNTILITSSMGQEPNPNFDKKVLAKYSGKISNMKNFLFYLNKFQKKVHNLDINLDIARNMAPQYGFTFEENENIDPNFLAFTITDFVNSIGLENKIDLQGKSLVLTINPNLDENLQKKYNIEEATTKLSKYGFEFFEVNDHHSGSHSPYGILITINSTDSFEKSIADNIEDDGNIDYLNFQKIILSNL